VTYLLDTNTCIGWLRQNQPQKAGVPHGPHSTVGGCVVLTAFSATLDFVLV
jgi:hypothetical protein